MKKLLLVLALALLALVPSGALAQLSNCGITIPQVGLACIQESNNPTYAATGIGIAPAASATDIACLTGSATKVIRVKRIRVSGSAGTLVNVPLLITKHASANTGGTAATGTALPVPYTLDTANPAVTATATAYTANPTITDAAAGIVSSGMLVLTATGTLAGNTGVIIDWTNDALNQGPILRGIAQQVCVNLNATSPSSGLVNVTFLWTEMAQ